MKRKETPKKETDWAEVDRILEENKDQSVFQQLRLLRGKIHFGLTLEDIREMREDRD